MDATKDCPLCGEKMRRKVRDEVSVVPGTSETKTTKVREWICPDCDYFEEYEESDQEPSEQP